MHAEQIQYLIWVRASARHSIGAPSLGSPDPCTWRVSIDVPSSQSKLDSDSVSRVAQSLPPRPFPKLPAPLLEDASPSGTLYSIICKTFQMKEAKNIRKLEWRNPQLRRDVRSHAHSPNAAVYD
jgi:hypothetical protein